jgi:hypothetical protein
MVQGLPNQNVLCFTIKTAKTFGTLCAGIFVIVRHQKINTAAAHRWRTQPTRE